MSPCDWSGVAAQEIGRGLQRSLELPGEFEVASEDQQGNQGFTAPVPELPDVLVRVPDNLHCLLGPRTVLLYPLEQVRVVGRDLYEVASRLKTSLEEPGFEARARHEAQGVRGHDPLQAGSDIITLDTQNELVAQLLGDAKAGLVALLRTLRVIGSAHIAAGISVVPAHHLGSPGPGDITPPYESILLRLIGNPWRT